MAYEVGSAASSHAGSCRLRRSMFLRIRDDKLHRAQAPPAQLAQKSVQRVSASERPMSCTSLRPSDLMPIQGQNAADNRKRLLVS